MTKLTVALSAVLLLMGCGAVTPRAAAEGYLDALSRLDFAAAAHHVVDDGKAKFQTLSTLSAQLDATEREKFQVSNWKVVGETVVGDLATVEFTFDGDKQGQLTLRRLGGVWKVEPRRTF